MTWLFLDNMYYVETIGFLAVFAEAMLGAPQFYRNFVNKSTHGMRYVYQIVSLLDFFSSLYTYLITDVCSAEQMLMSAHRNLCYTEV